MEKLWAEHLTVWATTIFLPWEVYEIIRHPDWIRVALLLINLSVLAYLVWAMRRNRRMMELAKNVGYAPK
jgi:uncharacterized membrane protein (DUF2068 family)